MKHCVFFILFIAITLPASEQPPFHIDGICFDDTSDKSPLSQTKLALAFSEAANSYLRQADRQPALNNNQLLSPTSIIPDEIPMSFTDEPPKCSRYYKTIRAKETRKSLKEILEKNKQKLP